MRKIQKARYNLRQNKHANSSRKAGQEKKSKNHTSTGSHTAGATKIEHKS